MKLLAILIIMLSINVFLFLGQTSINNLSGTVGHEGSNFFNYENSLISQYDEGNYTLTEAVEGKLPEVDSSVSTSEGGNFFTDAISSSKNWFLDTAGINYLLGIVNAVPNFLKSIGLPKEITFALGFFWYSLSLFLVVAMILGRNL